MSCGQATHGPTSGTGCCATTRAATPWSRSEAASTPTSIGPRRTRSLTTRANTPRCAGLGRWGLIVPIWVSGRSSHGSCKACGGGVASLNPTSGASATSSTSRTPPVKPFANHCRTHREVRPLGAEVTSRQDSRASLPSRAGSKYTVSASSSQLGVSAHAIGTGALVEVWADLRCRSVADCMSELRETVSQRSRVGPCGVTERSTRSAMNAKDTPWSTSRPGDADSSQNKHLHRRDR